MVCDKVVCERWRVTKLCERECVTNCVWKMVCVKDDVWQSCVAKEGVWQSCVWKMVWWKMVCDKVVCEGWCGEKWWVTKWCVKDDVWQSCVWKRVCETWCVTKLCGERGCVTYCMWGKGKNWNAWKPGNRDCTSSTPPWMWIKRVSRSIFDICVFAPTLHFLCLIFICFALRFCIAILHLFFLGGCFCPHIFVWGSCFWFCIGPASVPPPPPPPPPPCHLVTSAFVSRGKRGIVGRPGRRATLRGMATWTFHSRGRHDNWRHRPSFRVAGVTWRNTCSHELPFRVAGVALGDIFALRGKRGTWRHRPSFDVASVALMARGSCAAGVGLGHIDHRFAWHVWLVDMFGPCVAAPAILACLTLIHVLQHKPFWFPTSLCGVLVFDSVSVRLRLLLKNEFHFSLNFCPSINIVNGHIDFQEDTRRYFSKRWGPILQRITLPRAHLFCSFFAFVLFYIIYLFNFIFILLYTSFPISFKRNWGSPIRIFRLATCPLGMREPRHCVFFFGFTGSPRTFFFKFNVSLVFCVGFTLSKLRFLFPCVLHLAFSFFPGCISSIFILHISCRLLPTCTGSFHVFIICQMCPFPSCMCAF